MFELRATPLDVTEVLGAVSHPTAGAVDVFVGQVRDHDQGRAVTALEYEAYLPMAAAELARIGEEIAAAIPGVRLAVLHRVGKLAVGELALVAAASAAHRAEAFAATRRLVDEIKARVPIWKRQHGPAGATWVGWEDARCAGTHAEAASAPGGAASAPGAHAHGAHHSPAPREPRRIAVVTLSDTRGPGDDPSGDRIEALLTAAGHQVVRRHHLRDEPAALRELLLREAGDLDAVVTTGGTGITRRDRTVEALRALLELPLEGFGEAFRRLSFDEIGARGLLSRAVAGTLGTCLIFALPGSPGAVQLGVERLILPMLDHAVAMVRS
jgi:molybdopterin synthase catalytic subunit